MAGGSHRYTVDSTWTVPHFDWTVPHFEKMLYDNGQALEYWANLWSAGHPEPAFARAIATTVHWLQREMTAPQGYFYAAQDADSFPDPQSPEPKEGAFYVWSYDEVAALLSAAALSALAAQFTLTPDGNFEAANVLQRRTGDPLDPGVEAALDHLFAAHYGSLPAPGATLDLQHLDRAEQGLRTFAQVMTAIPRACPSLFTALDWFCHGTLVRTRPEYLSALLSQYAPTALFIVVLALPAETVGLVCEGLFCKEPAQNLGQLQRQLQASQRRSRVED